MVGKNIKRSGKMALSKKPVTGMKDILPEEMKIRNYVQNVINDTYKALVLYRLKHLVLKIFQISQVSRVVKTRNLYLRF